MMPNVAVLEPREIDQLELRGVDPVVEPFALPAMTGNSQNRYSSTTRCSRNVRLDEPPVPALRHYRVEDPSEVEAPRRRAEIRNLRQRR